MTVNLFRLAFECLTEPVADKKTSQSNHIGKQIETEQIAFEPYPLTDSNIKPGRPSQPELINPKYLAQRNIHTKAGRAASHGSFLCTY